MDSDSTQEAVGEPADGDAPKKNDSPHGANSSPSGGRKVESTEEFLWRTITYLEGRIALVDNKASIAIALFAGTGLALMLALLKEADGGLARPTFMMSVAFVVLLIGVFLWLLVIRPTWRWRSETNTSTAMWLRPGLKAGFLGDNPPPADFYQESYKQVLGKRKDQYEALRLTHKALLKFAARKMARYYIAMFYTRAVVVVVFVLTIVWTIGL